MYIICGLGNPGKEYDNTRHNTGFMVIDRLSEEYGIDVSTKNIVSSMDSDLEAFSHYPADGSVAALPGRTAAKTNYLNQRFLTYLADLLSRRQVISRVKLTCLTTV